MGGWGPVWFITTTNGYLGIEPAPCLHCTRAAADGSSRPVLYRLSNAEWNFYRMKVGLCFLVCFFSKLNSNPGQVCLYFSAGLWHKTVFYTFNSFICICIVIASSLNIIGIYRFIYI